MLVVVRVVRVGRVVTVGRSVRIFRMVSGKERVSGGYGGWGLGSDLELSSCQFRLGLKC